MKYFLYCFLTSLLIVPAFSFAQENNSITPPGNNSITPSGNNSISSGGGIQIPNPLGSKVSTVTDLFKILLDIVMIFAVPIVVFFIIYAGFLYVTARGNSEQISRAHNALLYALIGGVLILGANVLIEVIQGTVNSIKQ